MMPYRMLVLIAVAATACVFLLVRGMRRFTLRVQFAVLLGLGVSIGFILLVMLQMPSFPHWPGVSLMVVVFAASFFGVRIFMRNLAQEDKKTEDEGRREYLDGRAGDDRANPNSARDAR